MVRCDLMVYHGTSATLYNQIASEGIQPRWGGPHNQRPASFREEYHPCAHDPSPLIYLATELRALYYAARTGLLYSIHDGLVARVNLATRNYQMKCYPDESFYLRPGTLVTREEVVQARDRQRRGSDDWEQCWRTRGLMAYSAKLSPDGLQIWPQAQNPWRFLCTGTVQDFDWNVTVFDAVFRHYRLAGFLDGRLSEYAITKEDESCWRVNIPDHDMIRVTR